MNRIYISIAMILTAGLALAEHHATVEAEVRDTVKAFNAAYAENRVDDYFSYYADDPSIYFFGARQDVADYHAEWKEMIANGAGVETNELSDLRVEVMPGGDIAVATYFIDYRFRSPEGEISAAKAFESEVWRLIDGNWRIVNLHYSEIPPE